MLYDLIGPGIATLRIQGRRWRHGLGRQFALAMILAALINPQAWAHKASVFAAVQGKTISGEAYFRDGTPVRSARVTVFDPEGKPLAEAQTDSKGKFSVPLVRRCNHRVVVDAGDGHVAEYLVHAEEIPADLPGEKPPGAAPAARPVAPPAESDAAPSPGHPTPLSDAMAGVRAELEALQTQLVQLRRDLAAREDRARWSDVLGGIGYIVGLMGLAFYFLGVSAKSKKAADQPEPTSAPTDSR
jgi:nickel transport protein